MAKSELTITKNVTDDEMSKRQVEQALALLARWACKKAQKQAEAKRKPGGKVVTVYFSRDYTSRKLEN